MIMNDHDIGLVKQLINEANGTITHKADIDKCDCARRAKAAIRSIDGLLFHQISPEKIAESLADGIFPDTLRSFLTHYSGVNIEIPQPAWARGVPGLVVSRVR